jgi:hypothetical protein
MHAGTREDAKALAEAHDITAADLLDARVEASRGA